MKRILTTVGALALAGAVWAANAPTAIELPAPRRSGGMPLMDALAKRATARAFSAQELAPQQLSDLLWAAFGINRPDGKRTAPSARNWQEVDVYVLLASGAYLYDARANQLKPVAAGDLRALGTVQAFAKDAPVTLVFVADLARMGGGDLGQHRETASLDVGYLSQNTYLYCAAAGLATGARASLDRETLGLKLNLRPEQLIVLAQSVGYPKP